MRITQVKTHLLTAHWAADPWFPQMLHSTAIIRIETDAGIDGLGEVTWGYFAPDAVPAMVEYFRPLLVGREPGAVAGLTRALCDNSVWWARSGAGRSVISGIEMALWDLWGKSLGLPVYKLLGGAMRERVPVYASGGTLWWPVEESVRKVVHYAERGYRAAKLSAQFYDFNPNQKVGAQERLHTHPFPFPEKLKRLADCVAWLRQAAGDGMDLAFDGHQGGVPNPIPVAEAIALAEAIAPYRPRFYEEPLAYTNLEGYRDLRAASTVPIAGGESLCGLDQFHTLIAGRAVDLIQPDVGFVGGIGETVRVMHHAEAHNLRTALHTGASAGPCLAASWHLAAATESIEWLEHVYAASGVHRDLLIDEFKVKDGTVGLPEAPGLGVHLTDKILEKYRFVPNSGERT